MDKNETPLQRMRIAIDAQGHFGSDGDETLNRQDIQLYALASIAESLARIADVTEAGPAETTESRATFRALRDSY